MLNECLIGEVLQCHIDHSDPESFIVGRLAYFDSNWFLMQDLSPTGHWNGLALYMKSDIVEVNTFTDYIAKLVTLAKCRNEVAPMLPPISNDILRSLLLYAKDANRIVGLELHESGYRDINGTVADLNQNTLCMNQIDEFGRDDGISYLTIDAITRCYLDDAESTCLEILREHLRDHF